MVAYPSWILIHRKLRAQLVYGERSGRTTIWTKGLMWLAFETIVLGIDITQKISTLARRRVFEIVDSFERFLSDFR